MSEETKPLTEAELAYLHALNDEARAAYQRHQEAQRRLIQCVAFLQEQHEATEEGWELTEDMVGFERAEDDGNTT